jgi:hypothetical protein
MVLSDYRLSCLLTTPWGYIQGVEVKFPRVCNLCNACRYVAGCMPICLDEKEQAQVRVGKPVEQDGLVPCAPASRGEEKYGWRLSVVIPRGMDGG